MSGSDLTPPGSSTYSSGTLYVGDGTWDKSSNTFLLPNLMGLNFATMQYNGMGNRFRDLSGYSSLIIAHGVMAAVVFLLFVPAGVLVMRYYSHWDSYWAHKYHAWLYVLSLLLSTAVFMTGFFAVGPERSLTNPHHGIGVALYVMLISQVFWGWLAHRLEGGKVNYRLPLKLMIHNWLGWAVVLLGLAQVPLGLTLYGSPKSLFILYSVVAFFWLALFFILSYLYDDSRDYDSRGSYASGPSVVEDRRHSGFGRTAAAAAAGAGLASLFRRRSRGPADDVVEDQIEAPPWRESRSSFTDEKDSDQPRRSGWGKRLLEVGAIAGAAGLAKRLFDRRRERDNDSESGHYRPAHARSDSVSEDTISRVEEGRATGPLQNQPPRRRVSRESVDEGSYTASDESHGHGVRDAVLGAGAFAAVRNLFKRRKEKQEDQRVEQLRHQDIEEERMARANSKRKYTGDGFFPRRTRPAGGSVISTDVSTDITPRPPREPGDRPAGSVLSGEPLVSGGLNQPSIPDVPPLPPTHRHGSEAASGHTLEAAAAGAIAGAAVGSATDRRRRHRSSSSGRRRDDVSSPPVSVKVKMHNDGRHVTLRRLTEEEAAANREHSKERRGSRRRHGSVSSLSGTEGAASSRWRRVEELERKQAEQIQRQHEAVTGSSAISAVVPPPIMPQAALSNTSIPPSPAPPPVPPPAPSSLPYGATSVASPGTWTGTDASGDYASNRRRRRAERAQARQARQQSVEFT